jgi:hypothetical protein
VSLTASKENSEQPGNTLTDHSSCGGALMSTVCSALRPTTAGRPDSTMLFGVDDDGGQSRGSGDAKGARGMCAYSLDTAPASARGPLTVCRCTAHAQSRGASGRCGIGALCWAPARCLQVVAGTSQAQLRGGPRMPAAHCSSAPVDHLVAGKVNPQGAHAVGALVGKRNDRGLRAAAAAAARRRGVAVSTSARCWRRGSASTAHSWHSRSQHTCLEWIERRRILLGSTRVSGSLAEYHVACVAGQQRVCEVAASCAS